jgi:hypothetical protein
VLAIGSFLSVLSIMSARALWGVMARGKR